MSIELDEPQLVGPVDTGGEVGICQFDHIVGVVIQGDDFRLFTDFQTAATVT